MDDLPTPSRRARSVGRSAVETQLRAAIEAAAFSHGWLITGPKGAGKATLAYRTARALLDPAALAGPGLSMPEEGRAFRLVAGGAHPDLFVAERQYDEKADRMETEISVETIRRLTAFLNRTASMGGWRVAIVDTADDMNRNAANALLKALEEPPSKTTLLLLSAAPGRLLATIRSRCRRIALRPEADETIAGLVQSETALGPEDAARIAAAAHGRPGYALTLAAGEGGEAVAAADDFLRAAAATGDAAPLLSRLMGKSANERWEIFLPHLLGAISHAARRRARGEAAPAPFEKASPARLAETHRALTEFAGRGDGLNLDRGQLILAMGRMLHDAVREPAR